MAEPEARCWGEPYESQVGKVEHGATENYLMHLGEALLKDSGTGLAAVLKAQGRLTKCADCKIHVSTVGPRGNNTFCMPSVKELGSGRVRVTPRIQLGDNREERAY